MVVGASNYQAEIDTVMLPMSGKPAFQGEDIKSMITTHEHLDH